MARIEGHVRGISNMIREDRPCPEVLLQLSAVRAALGQVARHILKEHLSDCVLHAAERGAAEQELQALHRALDQFIE